MNFKYRSRPTIIEAIKVCEAYAIAQHGRWTEAPFWVMQAYVNGVLSFVEDCQGYKVNVLTLEGTMTAGPEDMIIRGLKGELYPCKAEVFALRYDPEEPEGVRG